MTEAADDPVSAHSRASGNPGENCGAANVALGPRLRGDERKSNLPLASGKTLTPFDWRIAIGFGLGVLRLSPDAFWRMTPRELALAIEAVTGRNAASIGRHGLLELMRRFPDTTVQKERDHG